MPNSAASSKDTSPSLHKLQEIVQDYLSGSKRPYTGFVLSFLAYALSFYFGLSLYSLPQGIGTVLWPAMGVAIAMTIWFGRVGFAGALVSRLVITLNIALPDSIDGNEALAIVLALVRLSLVVGVMTYVIRRLFKEQPTLFSIKNFLIFGLTAFFSTLVAAFFSPGIMGEVGRSSIQGFGIVGIVYWGGDFLGVLLFTPLLLGLVELWNAIQRRWVDAVLIIAVTVGLGWFLFDSPIPESLPNMRLEYFGLIVLYWGVIRFYYAGAAVVSSILAIFMVRGFLESEGIFSLEIFGQTPTVEDVYTLIFELQVYLVMLVVPALLLSVLMLENDQIQQEKTLLSQQVGPSISEQLERRGQKPLAASAPILAMMHVDIVAFNITMSHRTPERLWSITRELHRGLSQIIFNFQGTIIYRSVDQFSVAFGLMPRTPRAVEQAVLAREKINDFIEALNAKLMVYDELPITLAIGIDYGTVNVGNLGSAPDLTLSAVGVPEENAKALAKLAAAKGEMVLMGDAAYESLKTCVDKPEKNSVLWQTLKITSLDSYKQLLEQTFSRFTFIDSIRLLGSSRSDLVRVYGYTNPDSTPNNEV